MKIMMLILLNILFLYTSMYDLQMLQQNSYNAKNRYYNFFVKDIRKNYKVYLLKFLFTVGLFMFVKLNKLIQIVFVFVLLVLIIDAYYRYKKHNVKLPLKFTKRMIRIIAVDYFFLLLVESLFFIFPTNFFSGMVMVIITAHSSVLTGVIKFLSPLEKLIYRKYKNRALTKLSKMPNLDIIGITGSFGKTSTKMILDTILKTEYKGFYTPGSFNTPNGVLLTINNEPTIFNDYFICEMGAKNIGDIRELCDIVHPKYGILTSVGKAHLESFGSLENVCLTKFELIESLPEGGVAILNKDDEYQRKYEMFNNPEIIWVGIDKKADVMAKNIKVTSSGTTFDIVFRKGNKIKVDTILLGKANIYNILAAAALANHMGISDKKIIQGIKNIDPISHRLELKKHGNITILDDAFNSNPKGAQTALEVLSLMDGNKIIITPGMIEMGIEQDKLNEEFGRQIAKTCDKVYLIGKNQTKPIYEGLIKEKYNEDNIKVYNSFKEAYDDAVKSSKKASTILIENDLPDSYMEG